MNHDQLPHGSTGPNADYWALREATKRHGLQAIDMESLVDDLRCLHAQLLRIRDPCDDLAADTARRIRTKAYREARNVLERLRAELQQGKLHLLRCDRRTRRRLEPLWRFADHLWWTRFYHRQFDVADLGTHHDFFESWFDDERLVRFIQRVVADQAEAQGPAPPQQAQPEDTDQPLANARQPEATAEPAQGADPPAAEATDQLGSVSKPGHLDLLVDKTERTVRREGLDKTVELDGAPIEWDVFLICWRSAPHAVTKAAWDKQYKGDPENRKYAIRRLNNKLKKLSVKVDGHQRLLVGLS